MLSPPESVGDSKSGAVAKDSSPPIGSMANSAASAPPLIENRSGCAGTSISVAVAVRTEDSFSPIVTSPCALMTGASFTGVTLTSNVV